MPRKMHLKKLQETEDEFPLPVTAEKDAVAEEEKVATGKPRKTTTHSRKPKKPVRKAQKKNLSADEIAGFEHWMTRIATERFEMCAPEVSIKGFAPRVHIMGDKMPSFGNPLYISIGVVTPDGDEVVGTFGRIFDIENDIPAFTLCTAQTFRILEGCLLDVKFPPFDECCDECGDECDE